MCWSALNRTMLRHPMTWTPLHHLILSRPLRTHRLCVLRPVFNHLNELLALCAALDCIRPLPVFGLMSARDHILQVLQILSEVFEVVEALDHAVDSTFAEVVPGGV